MTQSFLITGATGYQGGATARSLLAKNAVVHALVRNPDAPAAQELQKRGAILFKGDFDDDAAINAAAKGVSGVFVNLTPTLDPSDQINQAKRLVNAARASGTAKTIVVSTAFYTGNHNIWGERGPNHPLYVYYNTKSQVEQTIRDAKLGHYTILRPAWLMHNYMLPQSPYHFPELSTEGIMAHIYKPDTKMPHFDADDVGKFAAAALLEPERFNGHEIELGYENFTLEEARSILSKAAKFDIPTRIRSEEEVASLYFQVGTLMFQELANDKDLTVDGKALQEKYGIPLTTFENYLEREKEVLLKSIPGSK